MVLVLCTMALRIAFCCLSLVGTALCRGCLDDFEEGPFGPDAKDIPQYPRALSKAPGIVHAERVHHVYAKHLSLPEVVIQRSRSNWGDTGRLRALFHKLREGKPISMVVLGGSISCGGDTRRLEQQWTYQIFQWFTATFPHEHHAYINSCKPATPSAVVAACLDNYIPDEVDYIIFEYTVNDSKPADEGGITDLPVMENEWRRGFEKLVRKLVKLPSKPALQYLHMYQPSYMGHSFWLSAEMELETILQYYSIPTVSARNALYGLLLEGTHGFTEAQVHCGVHPNPLGHRYYADLVIANLQDYAHAALTVPEDHMAYPELFAGLQGIPPPMLEQNWDFDSECLTGELLHQAVVPQLSQHWEYVDEGKPGHPKLGFRTLLPDTSIVVQVNTRSSHKNIEGDILLAVGHLVSYEHMGRFMVGCVSGCTCEGVHNISGTHPSTTSTYKFIYFSATQHEHCHVKVTSIHDAETGGDKVKFDMLMVATGISGHWVDRMNAVFQ